MWLEVVQPPSVFVQAVLMQLCDPSEPIDVFTSLAEAKSNLGKKLFVQRELVLVVFHGSSECFVPLRQSFMPPGECFVPLLELIHALHECCHLFIEVAHVVSGLPLAADILPSVRLSTC